VVRVGVFRQDDLRVAHHGFGRRFRLQHLRRTTSKLRQNRGLVRFGRVGGGRR
jgi:hypothetical protein